MKNFLFQNFKNILLFLCFLMIAINCLIAIVINDTLYTGNVTNPKDANVNFIISLNEDYNKTDDIIKTKMLMSIDNNELEDLIQKLIMEYLTERYTVTEHKDLSIQKFIPVNAGNKIKQSILIAPRISKVILMGNGVYQLMPATKDFINQDKVEYTNLLKEHTTRSVEIINTPKRKNGKKDEWITRVKFVYKSPNIDYLKDAKFEIYDINMVVKMGDNYGNYINNAEFIKMYYPANVFNFTVVYLDKTLIR